ncbi:ubiquinone biosynthesis monooxygenase COQ6, mitochondrial-like [Saccoglossus kowalevskii]|uniref:Ubiquinone biosynthesis monooxygenase COQ6, mitochondrial n=1 Tax=Saccoglossus kowalevskii TaxID=10224 RepID=A0ABM0GSW4_SACKO|nr:PREDICTED: ubiquinone biosynthesis monooxygenase COQ6-like [Saccoglossus kowalevskii]
MSLFGASRLSIGLVGVRRSLPRSALLARLFCSTETESAGEHGFYHVTIAGGGMVGTAMACALGSHPMFEGKNILLLEAGPSKTYSDSVPDLYSNRVSSLNPGTVELLKSIGAWQYLSKMRVKPYKRIQVWDSCSDAMITFDRDNFSKEVAHIVENNLTINALSKVIDSLKGDRVETRYRSMVKTIDLPKQGDNAKYPFVKVYLENGEEIHTQLLIGADGANSSLRRMANINHINWSYDQSAVVSTLQLAEPIENNVAWQRFLPTGPIAMLPLSDTESSLVWSTSNQDAKKLVDLPEDQFIDAVNNAFWQESEKHPLVDTAGQIMGNVLSTLLPSTGGSSIRQLPPSIIGIDDNSRAMFPLGLGHSTQYVKPRLVLIGDAAHRVHPLAGLGVNLGFADVASLRDILVEAVKNAEDLGALPHLLDYETERQKHVVPIMATVDGLKRLFSTDAAPAVLLRSLGLQATNAFKPLKDLFVQGASR